MFVRIEMQLSQFYVCYSSFTILYTYHQYHDKYEEAVAALAQMEMRAVKAERLLEAALQYQSSQQKAMFSPVPSPSQQKAMFSHVPSPSQQKAMFPPVPSPRYPSFGFLNITSSRTRQLLLKPGNT
jgi:hypothetical protein